jgi:hypothetical protein
MQAGMHEIAVNVIVHYINTKIASASVVFLCLFIMVLVLYVEFLYFICYERRGVAAYMYFLVKVLIDL